MNHSFVWSTQRRPHVKVAPTGAGGGGFQEERKVADNEGALTCFLFLMYLTVPVIDILQCVATGLVNIDLEEIWKGTALA
jgi:hypothetical protein